MNDQLPLKINPFELCERNITLDGQLPLQQLARIAAVLENPTGKVNIQLIFGREKLGRHYIKGHVAATMVLQCQRCGQPVSYDINVEPCLSPVIDDIQAKQLPKEYDPLLTGGESISLVELVEEELLLSLPMIPKHEQGKCPVELPNIFK